jgi:ferrous iron transport protein B
MELPNYRMPSAKSVGQLLWEKASDFIHRAFSVIFIATIVIWLLQSFDLRLRLVADQQQSILAVLSGLIAPLLKPIGLGDWRICTALISGFLAKESVVSTLGVLYGQNVAAIMSTATAVSLLVFSLLYTPCVAAIASIGRELGKKWAVLVVAWQCVVAWVVALIAYLVAIII